MTEGTPRPPSIFDRAFLTGVEDVTEIILVRHGQQEPPPETAAPSSSWVDPPLTAHGREQARLVGERLSTMNIDSVYASPLSRARETGHAIARHHRLDPVIIDDLREVELFRDVPAERSVSEQLGDALMAGLRERMLREKSWDVYPYSESSFEFRKRVVNAIEGIIAANEGERVVIACHGGVINAFLGHMIGVTYDMFFRPAHASISVVAAGEGIRALHSLNDVHHLQVGETSFLSH